MRDKKHGGRNKMSVASIKDSGFVGFSARDMASKLLHKEYRGPGDSLEAAAFRLQTKYGVDEEIVLQGWRRDIRDMKASRWLRLFHAYCAAGLGKLEAAYDDAREEVAQTDPALVRLADFVAGRAHSPVDEEETEVGSPGDRS